MRLRGRVAVAAGIAGLIAVAFLTGRLTAPPADVVPAGGAARDYTAGLQAGEALGVQEGRALQEGAELPAGSRAPAKDAFTAGYTAGMNDVFNNYDGGWRLGVPYVVTLVRGNGPVTYRIASRDEVRASVRYAVCPGGQGVCEQR